MVIAVIQCRLGSSRFPRKALANLAGKPIIRHVVERALLIQGVDRIIVAVPWGDEVEIAMALDGLGVSVFAAKVDDEDVLGRFVAALQGYPECDTVMRITGDTPLIDQSVCEMALRLYRDAENERAYVWTDTHSGKWPDGLDVEVFSRAALQRAHETATESSDREHVTPLIRSTGRVIEVPPGDAFKDWPKVSIDEESDLERVRQMVEAGIA